jgi:hypothetical protein
MTDRHFRQLEHDLEQVLLELKKTTDPVRRRELLLEMRLLLFDADRFLLDKTEGDPATRS